MLQSLLPELGTDIKGQMQPAERLLDCSGYADRPDDFANLLRILHTDLRLITLTELGGAVDDAASAFALFLRAPCSILYPPTSVFGHPRLPADARLFGAVSLRDWLTREQRETRRGRAELMLAERAALWNAKPENRRLPSWRKNLSLRWFTGRRTWTEPQRRMMRRAGRVHATRTTIGVLLAVLLLWMGFEIYGRM